MLATGRRAALAGGAAASLTILADSKGAHARPTHPGLTRPLRDPFTLGVASGDPEARGVVLWTRLAPRPLAADGLGGMPSRAVSVEWQVAGDPAFGRVVRRGVAEATPRGAHSVHVEVDGLAPGREYFYRFRAEGHVSPSGRTRTAPAADSSPASLTVAAASCTMFEHGHFTAYRHLAEDEPDLVLHLGDYLYELGPDEFVAGPGNVRRVAGQETVTLAAYRQRHAQYKTDPDLQAAHAAAPWGVVWDDHEVDANWAGLGIEHAPAHVRRRRAAAFRAYYEHMPLRRTSLPRGLGMRIHRRLRWGDLATVHLLDTRQYRDDQACGGIRQVGCAERLDPGRSILGADQERWLVDGLAGSGARWDVLAQQVFFAQRDGSTADGLLVGMNGWDGYAASRARLLETFARPEVRNPVVLTGDVHRHYANELRVDFDDPSARPVGVELVTTSVTSGGDGSDRLPQLEDELAANPHLRFGSDRRGYLLARLDRDRLRADFKVVPYVRRPGAPVRTAASFVVEDRDPVLRRV